MRYLTDEDVYAVLTAAYHHRTEIQHRALIDAINRVPTAGVVERKHGKWTKVGDHTYRCSVCNDVSCCMGDYCPDCGADMRGGKDERAMG